MARLRDQVDQHGNAEQADQGGDDLDTAEHGLRAEGQAYVAGNLGDPDAGQKQAERAAGDTLDQAAFGQGGDQGKTEDGEPEVFNGAEGERHLGQWRGQGHQGHGADQAADDAGQAGDGDGVVAVAFFGERIAVESGRDGGRCARCVEKDRRIGAAVDGARVDRAHEDQGRRGRHGEGERHQHSHRHGCGQARNGADHRAGDNAEQGESQIERRQRGEQMLKPCHETSPWKLNWADEPARGR